MESTFGNRIRFTLSGESHGPSVSARVTGLPAGIPLDFDGLSRFLTRRAGGKLHTTPRKEADLPIFRSGITDGLTDGRELVVVFKNENVRRSDYDAIRDTPRPSHADYPARLRFGDSIDLSGGGHFSGRLTAPLCAVGYLCKTALEARGITVGAHLLSLGKVTDTPFDPVALTADDLQVPAGRPIPFFDETKIAECDAALAEIEKKQDSLGGVIECAAIGLPAGIGSPLGHGLENDLSAMLFVLGGLVGVEFGDGFASAKMTGSTHNDPWTVRDGKIVTSANHAGGIVAGISTGMPLLFRVAMKPTASIGKEQDTVSLSQYSNTKLKISGRHDPAIALRAVPCVEAVSAIVLLSSLLETEESKAGMPTHSANQAGGFCTDPSGIPDLPAARREIDAINRQMKELFLARLALSERVAELKREAGLSTLDREREKAILSKMAEDVPPDLVPYVTAYFESLMKWSRDRQDEEREGTSPCST